MLTGRLALYTTVYPGVEKYLSAWHDSVLNQTDVDFDIWIGVDSVDVADITSALGTDLSATWVVAAQGDSPAQIRHKAIEEMVSQYAAVVFVDSDDLLEPTRVEAARMSLQENEVIGCAMRLIDEGGNDLGIESKPPTADTVALLPRHNVFGLSNSAYRSHVLRRCLPIPADCAIVDWLLITRAWTQGASLSFDFQCRMAYRQHPSNIARVLPPFSPPQIIAATELVLKHYSLVLENAGSMPPNYRTELAVAQSRAQAFSATVTGPRDLLDRYVRALNELSLNHIWWECVAHPELEYIWKCS